MEKNNELKSALIANAMCQFRGALGALALLVTAELLSSEEIVSYLESDAILKMDQRLGDLQKELR